MDVTGGSRDRDAGESGPDLVTHRVGAGTIVVEDLNFTDPSARERGQGRRMKAFRRTVAGIPTAQVRSRLTSMAARRGITVVCVDPRYTSEAGGKSWAAYLDRRRPTIIATSMTGTIPVADPRSADGAPWCRCRDRTARTGPAPDASSCPARTPLERWKQSRPPPEGDGRDRCGHPGRTAQHPTTTCTARPVPRPRACPHPRAGIRRPALWTGSPGSWGAGRGP